MVRYDGVVKRCQEGFTDGTRVWEERDECDLRLALHRVASIKYRTPAQRRDCTNSALGQRLCERVPVRAPAPAQGAATMITITAVATTAVTTAATGRTAITRVAAGDRARFVACSTTACDIVHRVFGRAPLREEGEQVGAHFVGEELRVHSVVSDGCAQRRYRLAEVHLEVVEVRQVCRGK
jgi:hypothetical protein